MKQARVMFAVHLGPPHICIHSSRSVGPLGPQAGAEFVHGSKSVFVESLKASGYKV